MKKLVFIVGGILILFGLVIFILSYEGVINLNELTRVYWHWFLIVFGIILLGSTRKAIGIRYLGLTLIINLILVLYLSFSLFSIYSSVSMEFIVSLLLLLGCMISCMFVSAGGVGVEKELLGVKGRLRNTQNEILRLNEEVDSKTVECEVLSENVGASNKNEDEALLKLATKTVECKGLTKANEDLLKELDKKGDLLKEVIKKLDELFEEKGKEDIPEEEILKEEEEEIPEEVKEEEKPVKEEEKEAPEEEKPVEEKEETQ